MVLQTASDQLTLDQVQKAVPRFLAIATEHSLIPESRRKALARIVHMKLARLTEGPTLEKDLHLLIGELEKQRLLCKPGAEWIRENIQNIGSGQILAPRADAQWNTRGCC